LPTRSERFRRSARRARRRDLLRRDAVEVPSFEMLREKLSRFGISCDRPLSRAQHNTFELTHVSRPLERGAEEHQPRLDRDRPFTLRVDASKSTLGKRRHVGPSIAKWWHR